MQTRLFFATELLPIRLDYGGGKAFQVQNRRHTYDVRTITN